MIPFKDMTDNQLIMAGLEKLLNPFYTSDNATSISYYDRSEIYKEMQKRLEELRTNPSRAEWDEKTGGKPYVRTCSEAGLSFSKTDELEADNGS